LGLLGGGEERISHRDTEGKEDSQRTEGERTSLRCVCAMGRGRAQNLRSKMPP
jgi:hypothetical protein